MLNKLLSLLQQVVIGICLLPASFYYGQGDWLKKVLIGKAFFSEMLSNLQEVLLRLEGRNCLVRVAVKVPLSIAFILHQTKSFSRTFQRICSILGGAPAFGSPRGQTCSEQFSAEIYEYVSFITDRSRQDVSQDFVPIAQEQADFQGIQTKLIAFYLPQFHAFPLNDEWYGKGFTEWTNVTKAIPHYTGHYQPQLPIDMGYYDLNDINVMRRQVELAKLYGIHGFCFHYYWFSGTRLMDMPLFKWLEDVEIDFPFCLNWANENWSKLWDGGNQEVRYKQDLQHGDDEKFFEDILPFFNDRRYIKVKGKPVLIIYRPHLFDKKRCRAFVDRQRELAKAHGFEGLFIISVNSHGFQDDPNSWGLDAMLEFPPHGMLEQGLQSKQMNMYVNKNFIGRVWDGGEFIKNKKYLYDVNYKLFKGVCPSWDNTPRKAYTNGSVIDSISPDLYKDWLADCIEFTRKYHASEEQFVFINAWNEWAEGAHLEPDARYGYAYLQATKDALLSKGGQTWKE